MASGAFSLDMRAQIDALLGRAAAGANDEAPGDDVTGDADGASGDGDAEGGDAGADGASAADGGDGDTRDGGDASSGDAEGGRVDYNTGGEYVPLEDLSLEEQEAILASREGYSTGGEYQPLEDYVAEQKAAIDAQLEAEEITEEEAEEAKAALDNLLPPESEGYDSGGDYESQGSDWDEAKADFVGLLNKFNTDRWLTDPPSVALFTVFISFAPGMCFLECDGLGLDNEVYGIREGGVNHYVHQRPGQTTHKTIRFSRGYLLDPSALAIQGWRYRINSSSTPLALSGLIILHDDSMQPIGAWFFSNGMLQSWTGPKMIAGSNAIAIEELEIAHEGLTIIDTPLQLLGIGTDILSRMGSSAPDIPTDVMTAIAF